jgi:hypothetical protein
MPLSKFIHFTNANKRTISERTKKVEQLARRFPPPWTVEEIGGRLRSVAMTQAGGTGRSNPATS